jgi:prepilin-type N-terminal cleavage/methylation domain-containing protein
MLPAPLRAGASSVLGFTLIEILIVVVVIAILAAIAIPRYQQYRAAAYSSSIRRDLRSMAVAQEDFYATHARYADLASGDTLDILTSPGVSIEYWGEEFGWKAKGVHPLAYPITCAIFWGKIAAIPPATSEGQVECR